MQPLRKSAPGLLTLMNMSLVLRPRAFNIFSSKRASRHNGAQLYFNISTSKSLPNIAFNIVTSKCVSRRKSVRFFISHLTKRLRTQRFSESTFRASGAPKHWRNTVLRDLSTFSRTWIFFLLTLSLLWLFPLLLFHLSILSEFWLLNFLWLYMCPAAPQDNLMPSDPKRRRS